MDAGQSILLGLQNAVTPGNLLACFLGVLWGTLVGVLPGLGPVAGMTMLVPLTYGMDPTQGIIMMAGIYYGAQYGGSTTSILAAIPGEVSTAVTILDGHQMALRGRAGTALTLAAVGSFVSGTIGVLLLTFIAPRLVDLAISFGPQEYFALAFLGLSMSSYLSSGSVMRGAATALAGLMLSTVGMSIVTGEIRYTFGRLELTTGVEIVAVMMGVFGVAEVLVTAEKRIRPEVLSAGLFDFRRLMPGRRDWQDAAGPIARGSILGFFVGILPGAGATVSSFLSYAIEKRLSRHPEKFGTGIVEGVAGPESANNGAAEGAMIPLLCLGLPYNVVTAIMLNTMIVHGLNPSPLLYQREPEFFWTVIASMYVGNVMLLVLNLPLVGIWASLIKVPFRWLGPLILLFSATGVYSIGGRIFDVWVMVLFGVVGYFMRKLGFPAAPMALGLVLGPILERAFTQSLILSDGNPMTFVTAPVSGALIGVSALLLVSPLLARLFGRGERPIPVEGD